jgi:hypothetical protein
MNDNRSFQKFAAGMAILSAPIAIASFPLFLAPVGFDPKAFDDPTIIFSAGAGAASTIGWAALAQMFGYYLMLFPAAVVLWRWLRPRSPNYVSLFTAGGLIYILTGAISTSVTWGVYRQLFREFAVTAGQQREILALVARLLTSLALDGLAGVVNTIPGAIWWIGIGALLWRGRRAFGIVTVLLGVIVLMMPLGTLLVGGLGGVALFGWFILTPIWAVWLGIDLLRKPVEVKETEVASAAPTRSVSASRV